MIYLVNGSFFRNNSEKPNGMDVKIPKSTARIRTATCEDSPFRTERSRETEWAWMRRFPDRRLRNEARSSYIGTYFSISYLRTTGSACSSVWRWRKEKTGGQNRTGEILQPRYRTVRGAARAGAFPVNFVLYPKWRRSTGRISQIWLRAKYENQVFEIINLYFWLTTWITYENLAIYIKLSWNYGYLKSENAYDFSTFRF
jgi:hypothetical protein